MRTQRLPKRITCRWPRLISVSRKGLETLSAVAASGTLKPFGLGKDLFIYEWLRDDMTIRLTE